MGRCRHDRFYEDGQGSKKATGFCERCPGATNLVAGSSPLDFA